jgi:hypothetical protein
MQPARENLFDFPIVLPVDQDSLQVGLGLDPRGDAALLFFLDTSPLHLFSRFRP